jgi:hypothetical protein
VQETAGNTLGLIGIGKDFLNRTQMAEQVRERTDKLDYMLWFFTTKEMVSELKRLPTELEKIFASYISDKGLITRIYRELKKLTPPPNKQNNEEMDKRTKQILQRMKSKWLKNT